jgi:hypothetical protein
MALSIKCDEADRFARELGRGDRQRRAAFEWQSLFDREWPRWPLDSSDREYPHNRNA